MADSAYVTADELMQVQPPNKRVELVRGVLLVQEPASGWHGRVTMALARDLGNYVHAHDLGAVYAAETGFTLARHPDTVRAPDIAFVRRERMPEPEPTGFLDLAPDLVVEVLSSSDRAGEVLAKAADWLTAGTRLVWIVDSDRRLARVYRQDGSVTLLSENDVLDGEDVLPGFSCLLSTIL